MQEHVTILFVIQIIKSPLELVFSFDDCTFFDDIKLVAIIN